MGFVTFHMCKWCTLILFTAPSPSLFPSLLRETSIFGACLFMGCILHNPRFGDNRMLTLEIKKLRWSKGWPHHQEIDLIF
jgi:hypothetical protein